MQKLLIAIIFCLNCFESFYAQNRVTLKVKDARFENPLAFAFVTDSLLTMGGQTDINGNILLPLRPGNGVNVQLYGYKSKKQKWNGENPWIIFLESNDQILTELLITVKEDPAIQVIAKCLKNVRSNNPTEQQDFQFEQYSKMVVDVDRNGNSPALKELKNKKLLISETISLHQHKAPNTDIETIMANQMSGFEFPQSTIIGSQMQSFSAYDADFQILDRVLISPLGNRAMDRYEYKMLDTIYQEQDTTFVIQYNPKKRFQSNGLLGVIQIKTPEYALVQLTAEPFEIESSYYIKIQQKLKKKGSFFFPSEMNSFYKLTKSTPEIFGEIQTTFRNIEYTHFKSDEFTDIHFSFPSEANSISDQQWENLRYTPLSIEEKNTYAFMDSIGKINDLDNKVNKLTNLFQGQWMLGKLNLGLLSIYRYNRFEGSRLGLSLSTNEKFHNNWKWDFLYAYGFKDQKSKFGGGLSWTSSNNRLRFRLGYIDDVIESGHHPLSQYRPNLNQQVYEFFVTKMDYIKGVTFDIDIPTIKNLKLLYHRSIIIKNPHPTFTLDQSLNYNLDLNQFILRWTPGEKKAMVLNKEIVLKGYWPILQWGIGYGVINQKNIFVRHQCEIEKTFHSAYWGDLKCTIEGGTTLHSLPFNELNALKGSWNNTAKVTIAVPQTFETALNNQWYARKYAHFFVRYKIKTPLYQHPLSSPKITTIFNGGWGALGSSDYPTYGMMDYAKGFFETGIGLNDLLISKTGGVGVGCFTRIGQYRNVDLKSNWIIKINTNFLF